MAELKINALNQLRLLKQSTFKDPLCFLDEDIQNAQRAKAENITIETDYFGKKLTIFNDGAVLDDPQKLFSIAESGWDDETVKSENPFGIGFFSNIVVSDLIEIKTGDKFITFDVNNMLEKGDTQVNVQESEDYVDGFELTLHHFDYGECSEKKIKERVQSLSDFIHSITISIDGEELKHRPLTEWDDNIKFAQSIENDKCIGWIGAASNWSWNEKIAIYYKGRFVTNLDAISYAVGKLHIHDNILNLVAPDRKDIMKDEKLDSFIDMLKAIMTEFCNKLALEEEKDMSEFSNCIKYHFDKSAVKDSIKFVTFKTEDEHAMEYLSGMASECAGNNRIQSLQAYEVFLKNERNKTQKITEQNTIELNMCNIEEPDESKLEKFSRKETSSGHTSFSYKSEDENSLASIGAKKDDTTTIRGESIAKQKEPVFYLKFGDIGELKYKLFIARHYNLRIIMARNEIEYAILEDMKETDSGAPVIHISKLVEDIEISGRIKNMNLTSKEKRAEMLFGMISSMFDYEENIFVIGDVDVMKTIEISSIHVKTETKDENVKVLYSEEYDTIFIDRSILNDRKLTPNLSSKLNLNDMQFILANINNIAKALAGFSELVWNPSNMKSTEIEDKLLELLSRYEPSKSIPTLDDSCGNEQKHKLTRKEKKRNAIKAKKLNHVAGA